MSNQFGIDKEIIEFSNRIIYELKDKFEEIDKIAEYNQLKVIKAMQDCKVNSDCFQYSSGYGYNDYGRDTLEKVYAKVFKTEAALVRPQITCGTHALAITLGGLLRPGDTIFSPVGKPYDTLEEVIGIRDSVGSLKEWGIKYKEAELKEDGSFDYEKIEEALKDETIKVAEIQRSKGYATRPSFTVEKIGELILFIKKRRPDIDVMIDNCYGEFVQEIEPCEVGADIIVGSLIKNPGGGIAPIGGYIAGRRDLIEKCAFRMNAPGLGMEVGASLNVLRDFYEGFFLSPIVVSSAVKTAVFAARAYEKLGFKVIPGSDENRSDIIQAIEFNNPDGLIEFCRGIQAASPVDAHVVPEPWAMPGYDSDVIMAAGAFTQGSSIELSADGPIKPPYAVYFQGGLTWPSGKLGIMNTIQKLKEKGIIEKL